MTDNDRKFPNPDEIKKEFEDFVRNRFGGNVQVFAAPGIPGAQPFTENKNENKAHEGESEFSPLEDLKFELTPKQVKEYLDRFIIKQDEAKKALSIAVCDHYRHIFALKKSPELKDEPYAKQNVLLLGPTGVGKSYLIQKIAKLIGVPFVKADATRFSETGYMGANVDDLIKDLVSQADGDLELAQYGMVYIDEADKLASVGTHNGKDVNGRGVQFGLLKLMEETEVDLRSGHDVASQMQAFMDFQQKGKVEKQIINTRHILFIVSGAFTGLEDIIRERVSHNQIGFHSEKASNSYEDNQKYLEQVSTKDLIKYGFEPEFVGRLPVRVNCSPLSVNDLFDILTSSEETLIKQYKRSFEAYGIKIEFTDCGLRRIAELAHHEKTGARALMTITEKALRDYKFELPSTLVDKLVVDEALIDNPKLILEQLLIQEKDAVPQELWDAVIDFQNDFKTKFHMSIKLSKDAVELIHNELGLAIEMLKPYLATKLQGYEYGLKLIQQNTGQENFQLDAGVLRDPQAILEAWIRESYTASITGKPSADNPLN